MSSSINIYPFSDTEGAIRFGIQIAIFIVGLIAAHKLIIQPALRLYAERKKRTVGSSQDAKKMLERSNQLEHEYFTRLKEGADEAHRFRAQEISEAQKLALAIVTETQHKTNDYIKNVREQLDKETIAAKQKLGPVLDEVVNAVYQKLGLMGFVFLVCFSSFLSSKAYAVESTPLIQSFWYSVFWPYFQFVVFVAAIVYFARKPIRGILEKRRDDFRTKLSEAHEAVYLAEKKVKEYESKVASLEAELQALKERNHADAQMERERIIEDANKASIIILKDAEKTAIELIHRSKEEIKKELFVLAISEVEKRLTPEKLESLDQKLKKETIDNLKNIH